jgi:hypothetical protein
METTAAEVIQLAEQLEREAELLMQEESFTDYQLVPGVRSMVRKLAEYLLGYSDRITDKDAHLMDALIPLGEWVAYKAEEERKNK